MDEAQTTPKEPGLAFACLRQLQRWRRRDWLLLLITVFLIVALFWLLFSSPPPDLSPEAFNRIHHGMTEEEVETIIGARPGGYAEFWEWGETLAEEWDKACSRQEWADKHGYLCVGYDEHGYVCSKRLQYHAPHEEYSWDRRSWWERFKRAASQARSQQSGGGVHPFKAAHPAGMSFLPVAYSR
jgi:hypothetical protein